MAQFAVIGLGSFGATIATELVGLNHDVIGIDINKNLLKTLLSKLPMPSLQMRLMTMF